MCVCVCVCVCVCSGKGEVQKRLLELELEAVGIRLNKRKPNIYFKVYLSPITLSIDELECLPHLAFTIGFGYCAAGFC